VSPPAKYLNPQANVTDPGTRPLAAPFTCFFFEPSFGLMLAAPFMHGCRMEQSFQKKTRPFNVPTTDGRDTIQKTLVTPAFSASS
jgi:hypothetical protein